MRHPEGHLKVIGIDHRAVDFQALPLPQEAIIKVKLPHLNGTPLFPLQPLRLQTHALGDALTMSRRKKRANGYAEGFHGMKLANDEDTESFPPTLTIVNRKDRSDGRIKTTPSSITRRTRTARSLYPQPEKLRTFLTQIDTEANANGTQVRDIDLAHDWGGRVCLPSF